MCGDRIFVSDSWVSSVTSCTDEGHLETVSNKVLTGKYCWWLQASIGSAARNYMVKPNPGWTTETSQNINKPQLNSPMNSGVQNSRFREYLMSRKHCYYRLFLRRDTSVRCSYFELLISWLKYLLTRFALPEEFAPGNRPQLRSREFQ